jgi:trimeric autotransporter adhesin
VQWLKWLGRLSAGVLAALLLSSCGGFFPSADTIVSISLSPASAMILPNATQQFTATATFGNNTTGNVSSQVTWTSSAPSIATISSTGLATAVAVGTSTITATSGTVNGTASLTVSSNTITSITISPANPSISLSGGQTEQFTATATFSDGTIGDITTTSTWTSSNTSVAIINATGLATPVGAGGTTIGASSGGVAATTSLTVTQ